MNPPNYHDHLLAEFIQDVRVNNPDKLDWVTLFGWIHTQYPQTARALLECLPEIKSHEIRARQS